jgi:hypothetical protein
VNDCISNAQMPALGRSPALSNDRCAASNAAAMLTGRSRC